MKSPLLLTQTNKPCNCRPRNRADGGRRTGVMFTTCNTARVQQAFWNRVGHGINPTENSLIPVPSYSLRRRGLKNPMSRGREVSKKRKAKSAQLIK